MPPTAPPVFLDIDYLASGATDTGARPYTGTTALWNNASIFLTGPGTVNQTQVRVDSTDTHVRARVTNSTQETIPQAQVDIYLMNPFVGLTSPSLAVESFGAPLINISKGSFSPGHTADDALDANHVAAAAWNPKQSELDNSTNGHLCLLANVYSFDSDGNLADGAPLASADPFDVVNNAHHGQRNIALLASTDPQPMMVFHINPPLIEGHPTLLDIHALTSKQLTAADRWLLISQANVVQQPVAGRGGELFIPGTRGKPDTELSFSHKGINGTLEVPGLGVAELHEVAAASKAAAARAGGLKRVAYDRADGSARLRFESIREPQQATLTLHRDDAKGSLQAFDVVQRTEDGEVLGGMTFISLVTGQHA